MLTGALDKHTLTVAFEMGILKGSSRLNSSYSSFENRKMYVCC